MPSPFPGMDPYLENRAVWQAFHEWFIGICREELANGLPEKYLVRIESRVRLADQPETRTIMPDGELDPTTKPSAMADTLLIEPVIMPLSIPEEYRDTHLEIVHQDEQKLVTVLELLSLSNNSGPGYNEYLLQRSAILKQPVHLVELDLMVAGRRLPMRRPLPPGHYYALVARGDKRPACEVYAWTIRQPLPTILLPLSAPDADVRLDLGRIFARAYEHGGFGRLLNYSTTPAVPLSADELRWAVEQVKRIKH